METNEKNNYWLKILLGNLGLWLGLEISTGGSGTGIYIVFLFDIFFTIYLFIKNKFTSAWAVFMIVFFCILLMISNYSNDNIYLDAPTATTSSTYENNIPSYTITFDSDGGSEVESMVVNKNTWLKAPTKPKKSGYTFVRWEYNGQLFKFDRYVNDLITSDITLKAVWFESADNSEVKAYIDAYDTNNNNNNKNNSSIGSSGSNNSSSNNSSGNNSSSTSYSYYGYQQIYDEYSQKLIKSGPTSSISEMADILAEGGMKMAEYMYSSKGTDGQYATYEQWFNKLWNVYMDNCR